MRYVLVRYKVKPDRAEENKRLVQAVYAELHETQPAGLRYTTLRAADGLTHHHLAAIESDGNPLAALASFREFQEGSASAATSPRWRVTSR